MPKQSVTVSQWFNPKFNDHLPVDSTENYEHGFKVERAMNWLVEPIGKWLSPSRLQEIINAGVDVSIIPVKG